MTILKGYIRLRERSLNTKDDISSKRFVMIVSHDLFVLQVVVGIVLNIFLTVFQQPKLSVEHHQLLIYHQLVCVMCNLLIVLWSIGAIKNVDVAFANIIKAKFNREEKRRDFYNRYLQEDPVLTEDEPEIIDGNSPSN